MKLSPRIFFFAIFLGLTPAYAQDSAVDSLKRVLADASEDSNKVNLLINIGKKLLNVSPDSTIYYAQQALHLSNRISYQRGAALALKNIGIGHYSASRYVEALQAWQKALKEYEQVGDKSGVANMFSNMGAIYNIQGDDAKAVEVHLNSLKIAEEINDSLRILTSLINIGAVYSNKDATIDQAVSYYLRALPLSKAVDDRDAIGTVTVNLGEIYLRRGNDSLALDYFMQSKNAYEEGSENIPYTLNDIGAVYQKRGEYDLAIKYHSEALEKARKLDAQLDVTQSLLNLAKTYSKKGEVRLSIDTYKQAMDIGTEIEAFHELGEIYLGLSNAYASLKDYGNAFKYQQLLLSNKEKIYNTETDKKLSSLMFNFEIEKKQNQINLLTKDKEIQQKEISRQKVVRNSFIGGFTVVLVFAGIFFKQRNRISKEKKRSEELLLNILPEETAEELKATGSAKAKSFDMVTVMFTDFKNFTQAAEKLSAEELVEEINYCYSEFDKIVTRHGIEKIKTIGDAYMCAGGLPVSNKTHAIDVVRAGLEFQDFIHRNMDERKAKGQPYFELRLGIHTGPVVAGIVGIKKFAYDIWGDTVNIASRMESSGEVGKVNTSGSTYEFIKDQFECEYRGKIEAKHKGQIDMYFVTREKTPVA